MERKHHEKGDERREQRGRSRPGRWTAGGGISAPITASSMVSRRRARRIFEAGTGPLIVERRLGFDVAIFPSASNSAGLAALPQCNILALGVIVFVSLPFTPGGPSVALRISRDAASVLL